jgi:hypothetical protein
MPTDENSHHAGLGPPAPSYEHERRERLQESIEEYLEGCLPSDPTKSLRILLTDIGEILRARREHYDTVAQTYHNSLQDFAHTVILPFVKDHAKE